MEIGKIPSDVLEKLLDQIKFQRSEVLVRPKIGEDCAVLDFGPYACVMSTDPITGAARDAGRLAVHISCNDVASCGVEPIGLMVTLLLPPSTEVAELEEIMAQIRQTAQSLQVDIIGGHTEVTDAVNRVVISTTAVGRLLKDQLVTTSGAHAGDDIIMTKTAGLEGTSIIAADKQDFLRQHLEWSVIKAAQDYIHHISVVREGVIAGQHGVTSMHDITEGGILGALWEVAEASGTGFEVWEDRIPVTPETRDICALLNVNPLRLISSGSMLITCQNGRSLVEKLAAEGISSAAIGRITGEKDRVMLKGNERVAVTPPEADELYKALQFTE